MDIGGHVQPGFEPVREAFASVLAGQAGTGAAAAAWRDGEWVVDLWGGPASADGGTMGSHARATQVENVLRGCLGAPPLPD